MDSSVAPGGWITPVSERPGPRPGALDGRRLQWVLDFVEEHLEESLSLDSLSARACLSKFHFSRAFRIAVGTSPQRYVRTRRLRWAKSLLLEGRQSLANIAFACDFSSQANFSRAFRRAFGLTPGGYRRAFGTTAAKIRGYLADKVAIPGEANDQRAHCCRSCSSAVVARDALPTHLVDSRGPPSG